MWIRYLVSILFVFATATHAAGPDRLRSFLNDTKTARASFSQSVVGKSGRKPQQASGAMAFARPGKFRWTYEKPYQQLIVGDGEKLWVYDEELKQVTVKKLPEALGASPAALLAGDNTIERNYHLSDGGTAEGLEWVEAKPKSAESGFERIRMAFQGDALKTMVLYDNFGQVTTLTFSKFERNPSLASGQFRFTPPAGADVVGE